MKKILIVDDDQLIHYSLAKALQSDIVNIRTVETGVDAISEINSCFYDLCFLDVFLPDLNGLDLMKTIKELSPKTRIVIMTASDVTDTMKRDIEETAYQFVPKPFDLFQIKMIAKHATEGEGL